MTRCMSEILSCMVGGFNSRYSLVTGGSTLQVPISFSRERADMVLVVLGLPLRALRPSVVRSGMVTTRSVLTEDWQARRIPRSHSSFFRVERSE